MSDQNQDRGYSDSTGYAAGEQPWREERDEPEPKAIEGRHAGRIIPEEKQRHTMDDTGVGEASRVEGDDSGGGRGREGGLATGTNYGMSGDHQGTTDTPGGGPGTTHARGAGRDTEGAFGEETARNNANPHNDFRDAGISKREVGINEKGDRTQGGDM
ncbi:MAG TPA: hypothetical protein VFM49_29470 [Chloroflexia bacterium]|jgi:hypothetical protein|nr:hypothetical protein [Chloroflexia bacterium]